MQEEKMNQEGWLAGKYKTALPTEFIKLSDMTSDADIAGIFENACFFCNGMHGLGCRWVKKA
jgi:hypothetical protein